MAQEQETQHALLIPFGDTPVTTDLKAWFGKYNVR